MIGVRPILEAHVEYRRLYAVVGDVDAWGNVELGETKEVVVGQTVLTTGTLQQSPFPVHRLTVAQVLTLDCLGDPAVPGQDTAFGRYTERELVLTPFGLTLKCWLEVELKSPLWPAWKGADPTAGDWWDVAGAGQPILDGIKLCWPIAIRFTGFGWPTEAAPAFLSPRRRRVLAAPNRGPYAYWLPVEGKVESSGLRHHPNMGAQPIGPDGRDYEIESLSEDALYPPFEARKCD